MHEQKEERDLKEIENLINSIDVSKFHQKGRIKKKNDKSNNNDISKDKINDNSKLDISKDGNDNHLHSKSTHKELKYLDDYDNIKDIKDEKLKLKLLKVIDHIADIKDEKIRNKISKYYYKNAKFVSMAAPYSNDFEKRNDEYKKNKSKWIDKNGFRSFGNTRPKQIQNYMNLGIFVNSPLNHDF